MKIIAAIALTFWRGAVKLLDMTNAHATPRDAINFAGWHALTDGTLALYVWRDGRLCFELVAANWRATRELEVAGRLDGLLF